MGNMNVWPTDAADGAVTSEARWRKMGRVWTRSGVVAGQGGEMAPSLAFPNLTVRSGGCWVDGHYCELPGDTVLTATATGIAVVRFDPVANSADLVYRDGVTTPAQSPTGVWETLIASMAGSAMTDRRTPSLVAGVPGHVPQAGAYDLTAWQNAVADSLAVSAWTTPALPAGWVTPSGYQSMSYRTEQGGNVVALRGTAQNPATGSGAVVLFTLPVGMRPTAGSLIFPITTASVSTTGYATPRLSIVGSGAVSLQYGSWAAPNPHSVSLDGARFAPS